VDIWAAGVELTCDDNAAFVPQFCHAVEATVTWLLSELNLNLPYPELSPEGNHRRLHEGEWHDLRSYRFMDWGPTTDNVLSFIFSRGTDMLITFEFLRETHPRSEEIGKVFVAEMPERQLLRCLHQAVSVLRSGA